MTFHIDPVTKRMAVEREAEFWPELSALEKLRL
jgi:hypothetical protein